MANLFEAIEETIALRYSKKLNSKFRLLLLLKDYHFMFLIPFQKEVSKTCKTHKKKLLICCRSCQRLAVKADFLYTQ